MISLLTVVSLALGAAEAPEPATQPVLTLNQALEEAREKNLDLKVARARLDQALLQSRRAWAGYLPTVTVGGSYTRNSAEAVFALPGGGEPITIQPYDQLGAQAEVRRPSSRRRSGPPSATRASPRKCPR
ncbi:TolC family protein [Cystobacter fuscus]